MEFKCSYEGCNNVAIYKTKNIPTNCSIHKFMNQKCIKPVKKNVKVFCFISKNRNIKYKNAKTK